MKKNVSIKLTEETKTALKIEAIKAGKHFQDYVGDILEKHLEK